MWFLKQLDVAYYFYDRFGEFFYILDTLTKNLSRYTRTIWLDNKIAISYLPRNNLLLEITINFPFPYVKDVYINYVLNNVCSNALCRVRFPRLPNKTYNIIISRAPQHHFFRFTCDFEIKVVRIIYRKPLNLHHGIAHACIIVRVILKNDGESLTILYNTTRISGVCGVNYLFGYVL